MNENDKWGARIERGTIEEVSGTQYKVKSLSRDGVKTPWIEALSIEPELYANVKHDREAETVSERIEVKYKPTEYKAGDMVYYFMFSDGHGAILGKAK